MTPVKSPAAKRLGFSYSPHKIPLPVSTHKTYHMSKKDDALNWAMKHSSSTKSNRQNVHCNNQERGNLSTHR